MKRVSRVESGLICPTASVVGRVELQAGSSVWFHAVVRAEAHRIVVGRGSNVQDAVGLSAHGASLIVGSGVTIGHRALLSDCVVAGNCLIGIGSVLSPGAVLPPWSFVVVGSRVEPDTTFAPGMLIAGRPARALRPITDSERAFILSSAEHYIALSHRFRALVDCEHLPNERTSA